MTVANKSSQMASLFFGGLLPIIAFTLIEDNYGPIWGTVAGMIFGAGEIIFEWLKYKKISTITWIGNLMILSLGGISIISQDGIWFKLQPALFEGFFALFLWGSLILKKNFLLLLAEKQGQVVPEILKKQFNGIAFRTGVFFALHCALAVWAAFSWSTANWALLKGFGLTISFILYLGLEGLLLRQKIKGGKINLSPHDPTDKSV